MDTEGVAVPLGTNHYGIASLSLQSGQAAQTHGEHTAPSVQDNLHWALPPKRKWIKIPNGIG